MTGSDRGCFLTESRWLVENGKSALCSITPEQVVERMDWIQVEQHVFLR